MSSARAHWGKLLFSSPLGVLTGPDSGVVPLTTAGASVTGDCSGVLGVSGAIGVEATGVSGEALGELGGTSIAGSSVVSNAEDEHA